jgi:hypothetical protein
LRVSGVLGGVDLAMTPTRDRGFQRCLAGDMLASVHQAWSSSHGATAATTAYAALASEDARDSTSLAPENSSGRDPADVGWAE